MGPNPGQPDATLEREGQAMQVLPSGRDTRCWAQVVRERRTEEHLSQSCRHVRNGSNSVENSLSTDDDKSLAVIGTKARFRLGGMHEGTGVAMWDLLSAL